MTSTVSHPAAQRTTNDIGLGLLRQPSQLVFGPGQRRLLPNLLADLGQHALFCTDARMATTAEFRELVEATSKAGVTASVFAEVQPDLPRSDIEAIMARHGGDARPDVVVGIGGGSCLDAAKVASVLLDGQVPVEQYYGEFEVPRSGLPVVTVPTTAGTGAEITCISVVYDAALGMKVGVASPHLGAQIAIVDPELTLTCPPGLTAVTGADALSHLVEAFTARAKNPSSEDIRRHLYVGKNVLTDIYVRHGLELLTGSLQRAYHTPNDLAARSDVMLGAMCAGMGINTTGTAAAHAIQSPIGALTHTSHGAGVGALLSPVMRFNLPTRVPEFAELGRLLGLSGHDEVSIAQAAIRHLEELLDSIGIPPTLRDLGLTPDMFDLVTTQALKATRLTANNPRTLTGESIVDLLARGYRGDREWWGE